MSKPGPKRVSEREIEIRLAGPEDSETIADLIYEAFAPFEEEYTAGAFEYTTPNADAIRPRFEEGPIWIADVNGRSVGTVSGLPDGERFYIRSMAIKPSVQRGGIGQKLLDALEAHARGAGFEKLYLYTTYVLPGARRLYEKNGFYVLRETPPEEWFDMGGLEMEKNLSEPGAVATGAVLSVPPAIVGGSDAAIKNPPATAGGTDKKDRES